MDCYITATGAFLPGNKIDNERIPNFMGELDNEPETRKKILRMNGIKSRHYALDENQNATYDLYDMAVRAVQDCTRNTTGGLGDVSYLSSGSTNTPLVGPGLSSILHDRLGQNDLIDQNVEINSNAGICSSAAQALVNATRAVRSGEHVKALAVGVEQPSDIMKSTAIKPVDDRAQHDDIRKSKWFMSVFLRSMLSDGAGAFVLENAPKDQGISYKVDWTYSRSFANETPLCMKLENHNLLLSQDVMILAEHMKPCVRALMAGAMETYQEDLKDYKTILPHISSFFFKRYMLSVLREFCSDKEKTVDYWTNLETAGNTGAASIYIMLDEYGKTQNPEDGDKLLLFVPESGQFNFVIVSLTVVKK